MTSDSELTMLIGENIARHRKNQGIAQKDFADVVGIHRVQMNRIQKGVNSPSAAVLFKIADALGVSGDALRQINPKIS